MDTLELTVIPSPVVPSYVSEADYWATYYHDDDICYEWNDGILEEKPVSDFAKSLMYLWFVKLLDQFLTTCPIADVTALDLGFKLQLGTKKTIRRPDLGVIRRDNPIRMAADERTYQGIFDMCIESVSDLTQNDIDRDVIDKKWEYASAGVQEYYILDNKERYMAFFQRTAQGLYEPIPPINGVIYSQVLEGFCFRLIDLHRQPSLIELAQDEVYQAFVLPEYQAEKARAISQKARAIAEKARADREQAKAAVEKARADREQAKAEAEKVRADREQAKAALLTAKLRELGISLDDI